MDVRAARGVSQPALSDLERRSAVLRQPTDNTPSTTLTMSSTLGTPDADRSASHVRADEHVEHRTPGTYDPWFEKHGVKGFLSWDLLREDMPDDGYILGSSFPVFQQLSPRSEARRIAKVNPTCGKMVTSKLTFTGSGASGKPSEECPVAGPIARL